MAKLRRLKNKREKYFTEAIMIRVSPAMKEGIEVLAKESRRDTSDFIRLVFEDAIKEWKII